MLKTKRLALKPYSLDNAEKLNKWMNDPELLYYNDDAPIPNKPKPLEKTKKYIENTLKIQDDNIVRLGIHKQADSSFIGYCMIAFIDRYNKSCKVGITIGDRDEWGKGFGKEVIERLVEYCFKELDLNRVGAEIFSFNINSIKMFESVGFNREGIIRESVYKDESFVDEYVYGLLKKEWELNHKKEYPVLL